MTDPLGAQLRQIRNSLGWSLQTVEEKSEGRWKAVVVGSYERGDRAATVHKVRELLDWYGGLRLEILEPGDVVLPAKPTTGLSRVEYVVVYGPGDVLACESLERAESRASRVPGARVAYRTHVISELTFVDGES